MYMRYSFHLGAKEENMKVEHFSNVFLSFLEYPRIR